MMLPRVLFPYEANDAKNGFSLIELLVVLSILSIILFIAVPFSYSFIERQQTKHFLNTLESDVFYVQNQSFATLQTARLTFREDHYIVFVHLDGDIKPKIRPYPKNIQVNFHQDNRITFSNNGHYRTPHTISMIVSGEKYQLIFPLGKGRYYIEK